MSGCLWSRRKFLGMLGAAAGAAVAGVSGPGFGRFFRIVREAGAAEGGTAVSVASGGSAAENARKAVEALGGMRKFVSRGDVVVLKPNIGWDRTPEQAANTNPEVVVALGEMCLAAGAKEVRVFDRTCNEPRRSYVSSGIPEAIRRFAEEQGVADVFRAYHVEQRKFRRTAIPGALVLREWDLYRDALEADKVISVPVAKHHSLATVTLGLKNMMGVMGGNRGQIHFRLSECLVDINRRIPTALTVVDANRILLRNGPSGGNLADVASLGKVFASADIVAADIVAAREAFGKSPAEVPHIRKAMESGLGVSSEDRIRLLSS
ncbi:MAG: DUF362 domain-containing protein [Deltaproteobacteria bacterium]